MSVRTASLLARAGLILNDLLTAADVAGDSFGNTGREMLLVKNADASAKTITIVSQATVDGLAVADKTVSVDAGDEVLIGPFPPSTYNDVNQRVQITYSAVTSVTVAVVKMVPETN